MSVNAGRAVYLSIRGDLNIHLHKHYLVTFDIPFSNELCYICRELIVSGFSVYPDYVVWSFAASLCLHDCQKQLW
jgi:hypothetical protein